MQVSMMEIGRLNFYRASELHGGLVLGHLDGVSMLPEGGDDRVHSGGELVAPLPRCEEIDVFAGPVQNAMHLHGVPAGQCEPVLTRDLQTNLRKAEVDRFHLTSQSRRRRREAGVTHGR